MRLSLAPDAPPALLAPGVPDWLGADGTRVAWAVRDVLFWIDGAGVQAVRVPDAIEEVAADPAGFTVAMALGAVRVDAASARITAMLSVDEGDPLAVRPARDVLLVVAVPESTLVRLGDGGAIAIPDAATRARFAAPFADGPGLVWIDKDVLFRVAAGGVVHALGRAAGAQALAVGPSGSTLVALDGDTLCAAPRAVPAKLGHAVDVENARFSPDGALALAADEDGVVEIDVAAGKVLRRWDGTFAAVGYAPGPVRWDRAAGTLLDAEGAVLHRGFAGAAAAVGGGWLAGPGGAVWRLADGAPLRHDLPEGSAATDGVRVAVVDDTHVRVLDGASFEHGLVRGDDAVDLVALTGDTVTVQTLDGHAAAFALDGAERWRRADSTELEPPALAVPGVTLGDDDEPSSTTVGATVLDLPADGAALAGGAVWLYTDEGMLLAATRPSRP